MSMNLLFAAVLATSAAQARRADKAVETPAASPAPVAPASTFVHGPTGLHIDKPPGWFFLEDADVRANRERAEWSTDAWTAAIRSGARMPIVTLSSRQDPASYPGITPTVSVAANAVPGAKSASEVLDA